MLDMLHKHIPKDWQYRHFDDEEIIDFFTNNYIEEFKDVIAKFNALQKGAHRSDLFRYYYLYLYGGVYIDSDALLEVNITKIIDENDEFIVPLSALNNCTMFNGYICCTKKNKIMYEALKFMYEQETEAINNYYFINCKKLYDILNEIKGKDIKILKELILDDKLAFTFKNNVHVLTHYYNKNSIITSPDEIPKIIKTDKSEIKVGISFDFPDSFETMYSNGIKQNVIYLGELLLNIGYDCYFIVKNNKYKQDVIDKLSYDKRFKFLKETNILSHGFDMIIIMGYEMDLSILKTLKYMNTKLILYQCGNSYICDAETVLYKHNTIYMPYFSRLTKDDKLYDEIWSIPQMVNSNLHYWKTLFRTECIEVPFVWSPKYLEIVEAQLKTANMEAVYTIKKEKAKAIAICEPNISIMKWGFPALLVCENAYRKNKDLIETVFFNNVFSSNPKKLDMDFLNNLVRSLDLLNDKKLSIEGRYNILYFMSKHADFVVSHQWENNLNYLYLDLAWMGYAIIHNASLCKDIGYYYDQFNYEEGGNVLEYALKNHDLNKDEYLAKNRKLIDRYLPTNKELQNKYAILMDNVFSK
jgi:hypothetical protein